MNESFLRMWMENGQVRLNVWDAEDELRLLEERLEDVRDTTLYWDAHHDHLAEVRHVRR